MFVRRRYLFLLMCLFQNDVSNSSSYSSSKSWKDKLKPTPLDDQSITASRKSSNMSLQGDNIEDIVSKVLQLDSRFVMCHADP